MSKNKVEDAKEIEVTFEIGEIRDVVRNAICDIVGKGKIKKVHTSEEDLKDKCPIPGRRYVLPLSDRSEPEFIYRLKERTKRILMTYAEENKTETLLVEWKLKEKVLNSVPTLFLVLTLNHPKQTICKVTFKAENEERIVCFESKDEDETITMYNKLSKSFKTLKDHAPQFINIALLKGEFSYSLN